MMTKKNVDVDMKIEAINYYVDHIQVDLWHKRTDFFRDYADPLCAVVHGFISVRRVDGRFYGNYNKFKMSFYKTEAASEDLHLEHVVPLKVIENQLLKENKFHKKEFRKELLLKIIKLVIPCQVHKSKENELLEKQFSSSMPAAWNNEDLWARYREIGLLDKVRPEPGSDGDNFKKSRKQAEDFIDLLDESLNKKTAPYSSMQL